MNYSNPESPAEDDLVAPNARLHRTTAYEGNAVNPDASRRTGRWLKALGALFLLLIVLGVAGFFWGRHWMQSALRANLPVVDGQVTLTGLTAPVTVARDAQGVPHIRAASMDDLVFAQAYVTAGDRLWQMDALRRHAAGELAEVLGSGLVEHDKMQRTLQIRGAADRALSVLPADQMHWLEVYARGVNASIAEQQDHLPLEFRLLRYKPAPWTPRDSLLVGLAMFQDLTTTFPDKLDREALSAKLAPDLLADLYPVGSWRDHPAGQPPVDLTAPQPEIEQVPLDESQSSLRPTPSEDHLEDLSNAKQLLASASARYLCDGCIAGSNGWAVAGSKTRSGKPMLSSDMHLSHGVPGIWYMASLESGAFHVSGVTLPGTPFVIVGHNQHIAWGFTNLGADVQDLLIEQTRGEGSSAEFQAADGSWHPLLHQREVIHVKGGSDVVLDIAATQHGNMATPIISGMYPHEKRSITLRWSIYDPANITSPFYGVNSASDWQSLRTAISGFGGPSQNLMYADDQGHIGYHGIGRIPVRGSMSAPTPLSPLPVDGRDPGHDWAGYIPFDQMPQSYDPPGGIVATANARITPDGYPFPVTLDWAAPYRNERIWKVLGAKTGLVPADMLALQTDVYSDLDKVIAQRLAYAIDHSSKAHTAPDSNQAKRLRQAADLMRVWDGTVEADSAAPAIVDAARAALWPMLLEPQLSAPANSTQETKTTPQAAEEVALYNWGEKSYAEEQIIVHAPSRWLPVRYADWNELLTAAVESGLVNEKAPGDLSKWRYGRVHPVDIEHPIFSQSPLLGRILGMRTGTGVQPQSGDGSTVKQVGRKFGPSERLTVDFSNLENSTLNVVLGESANPASEWFMDQWPAWYHGTTFPMPFSEAATNAAAQHTLTLVP
jgi:penicillin amidase